MKWKVCGMKFPDNILEVIALQPDYLGFIFYDKSPRCCKTLSLDSRLRQELENIKTVGVFVNETADSISRYVETFGLDFVQLHSTHLDTFEELKKRNIPVIKVFGVAHTLTQGDLDIYNDLCDYFLFDTQSDKHGGTGVSFNWDILKPLQINKDFFLAGGIHSDSLDVLEKSDIRPFALDINSKFEIVPGQKDITLLKQFKQKLESLRKK